MTTELAPLIRDASRAVWAYVDASVTNGAPAVASASLRNDIRTRLEALHASPEDIDALDDALADNPGVGSPASRYLLIRDGRIEVDEVYASPPLQSPLVGAGLVPDVVPLLRHRSRERSYLVVETTREGGDVRLCRAEAPGEEQIGRVDGDDDDHVSKVRGGGWSNLNYQEHTEEVWKRTQGELAELVAEVVREHRPSIVAITGDVRARQLLRDQLPHDVRELVVDIDSDTAADGASDHALEERLGEALEAAFHAELSAVRDDASVAHGDLGARGVGPVVEALQQAAVDTVAIEPGRLGDRTALALAAPPWIAMTREEALGADIIGAIPASVAIARSAVLTDARLVFDDPEHPLDDSGVVAALRWHTGPDVPGH